MANEGGLQDLLKRLDKLGVNVNLDISVPKDSSSIRSRQISSPVKLAPALVQTNMQGLLQRVNQVEAAISRAGEEHIKELISFQGDPALPRAATSPLQTSKRDGKAVRKMRNVSSANKFRSQEVSMSTAMTAAASLAHGGTHGIAISHGHARSLPVHAPLSSVLAQLKESETTWAHEKARLRREADVERRRALKIDVELQKATRMLEDRRLDTKALKSALKNRDNQLAASGERIKELEDALNRSQAESANRISTLTSESEDLKALLLATLQRLETVDQLVQRADASSNMMQDKMKNLEDERLRALEAAARARAEVQELSESRRKLQWQSKLLEKMSEVQLKHNKHKSEAIRKLLSQPPQFSGGSDEADEGRHFYDVPGQGGGTVDYADDDSSVLTGDLGTSYRGRLREGSF
ncbi:hypothetical protein CEUSTIGMA_g12269.t1 [Chlamydomonas eustigma]|uniref:Uncharacterized protein n=1 Tax=Chlamydomonas eustigma TaxID=1157962 RepID=A0A250XP63_9CHLO|nr:hypothetical protein CEUSTIGMA_g12269.t1 [Chlamydomonas eustigma]|eukprot:GAX84848.1 hypothetical protein CEUSTIGMA_g12269.t1 [Chlamydomonas eustigma]